MLVPLNTRFKGGEAAYVLGRSRARVLFTVNGFLDTDYVAMLARPGRRCPTPRAASSCSRGDAPDGTLSLDRLPRRAGDVVVRRGARRAPTRSQPDDLSDIIFTSGTTGQPKGAMTTHAQTLRAFDALGRRRRPARAATAT